MKGLSFLLVVAAISGLALISTSSSASPLASGIALGTTFPELNEGLVQNVQIGSCREKRRDWTVQQRQLCSQRPAKPKNTKK
jgi:hypothetical protein